jgi:hypothetical protein
LKPGEPSQADPGKVSGLGYADDGGCGHQILLRGPDIRAPLKQ